MYVSVDWLVIAVTTYVTCRLVGHHCFVVFEPDEDIDTRKQVKLSRTNVPHACF
jgi:hypothetical protein